METNTNFKISIPKPCHEDWNKFTPDEKGAFCKVCSKSVYDFTKKSPEEIKTVLVEQISAGAKVCGRFNEDQLTPTPAQLPALDTYSLNFKRIKRFAMALFLVFGGFLFNSTKSTAQKIMGKMAMPQYHEPVRGEIAISKDPEPVLKDTARVRKDTVTNSIKVNKCSSYMMKGDIMIEPVEKITVLGGPVYLPVEKETVKGNVSPAVEPAVLGQATIIEIPESSNEHKPTMGSVAVIEDIIAINDIEPIIADTVVNVMEVTEETPMIMGLMVALPYNIETPDLINPIPSDSIQQIIDGEFAVEESTYVTSPQPSPSGEGVNKVLPEGEDSRQPDGQVGGALKLYPNPSSSGEITLRYNLKEDGMASISLFDLNGNWVKTLVPFQSFYASSYETKYYIGDLKAGIYFCELISGNNKSTARIVLSK